MPDGRENVGVDGVRGVTIGFDICKGGLLEEPPHAPRLPFAAPKLPSLAVLVAPELPPKRFHPLRPALFEKFWLPLRIDSVFVGREKVDSSRGIDSPRENVDCPRENDSLLPKRPLFSFMVPRFETIPWIREAWSWNEAGPCGGV